MTVADGAAYLQLTQSLSTMYIKRFWKNVSGQFGRLKYHKAIKSRKKGKKLATKASKVIYYLIAHDII